MVKMDEVGEDLSKIQPNQCLFPIASNSAESIGASEQQGLLFPCVTSLSHTKKQESDQLDWLVNQSFQTKYENDSKQEISSIHPSCDKEATVVREVSDDGSSSEEEHHQKKHKKRKKRKRDDSESSDDGSKRHRHKKKERKKKQRKETKKHSLKEELNKPDTIWIEESGLTPNQAYRVHRKPDPQNLMYGSLYRLDVATYKIKSNLLCLGLKKNQTLILSEKKKKKDKRKDWESRYWRDTAALFEPSKAVLPSKLTSTVFVNNVDNFAYIPIDLPSSRDGNEDNDEKSTTESTECIIDPADRIVSQRTAELNKILRENPNDIKTWIELANFQVKAVNQEDLTRVTTTAAGNTRKKKHSKVVTEKQIAVLEKALEQNPSSIELIMYHLELCNNWWDHDKLVERWRKIVFAHPNKIVLWRKYLLFLQSRVSMFTFRKAQRAYEKCFTMLSSIKEGTFVSHRAEAGIEEDMLDLFVQQCKFMKQSGHMEKCVASFQAMIELNCLCPDELNTNTPSAGQIAFLETFWDSGQPRFGETGAVGWKTWMDKTTTNKKPLGLQSLDLKTIFKSSYSSNENESKSASEKEEDLIKGLPKWKAWLKVEVSRDQTQLKPWQPDQTKGETEDDCEDPERIVLFDDISSSLFKLQNPHNKLNLVSCLLEILGVPLYPLSSSQSSDVHRYFEISVESVEQILNHFDIDAQGVGWQRCGHWYHFQDESHNTSKPFPEMLQLVHNVFAQSISLFEGDSKNYLITTWLLYEFYLAQLERPGKARKQRNKEVFKLAKAILKEPSNRNNFAVWEVFAKIMALSGDVGGARHVFDSTLLLASQLELDDTRKRITLAPLYRSYVEMEVKQTMAISTPVSHNRALHLLVSFAENSQYEPITESTLSKGVSSARILRAKRTFSQLCDNAIQGLKDCASEDGKMKLSHVHSIACCAWFSYATSGIQAAIAVYEKALSSLSSMDDALHHEHLWTSYLHLLKIHTKQENMPLKSIKQAVHRAIGAFPNNPFFLDYFLQVELKSNLTGEVRRFFDHLTHNAIVSIPWIYAIHYETIRSKALLLALDCNDYRIPTGDRQSAILITSLPTTGISHRQRALFDRATSSVAGRQCIALWRMYIEFELNQGNKEQAKAVFYQALQNCAWAKTLYLDAVKAFPDDLQNIMDMMIEKELRVRTPLEEIDILMEVVV